MSAVKTPRSFILSLRHVDISPFSSFMRRGDLTQWLFPTGFQSVLDLAKYFWS